MLVGMAHYPPFFLSVLLLWLGVHRLLNFILRLLIFIHILFLVIVGSSHGLRGLVLDIPIKLICIPGASISFVGFSEGLVRHGLHVLLVVRFWRMCLPLHVVLGSVESLMIVVVDIAINNNVCLGVIPLLVRLKRLLFIIRFHLSNIIKIPLVIRDIIFVKITEKIEY